MFEDIPKRTDLQAIREFILHGSSCKEKENVSYEERIKTADQMISSYFQDLFPDPDQYEEVTWRVYTALTTYKNVFFELGMESGAKLACELLGTSAPSQK